MRSPKHGVVVQTLSKPTLQIRHVFKRLLKYFILPTFFICHQNSNKKHFRKKQQRHNIIFLISNISQNVFVAYRISAIPMTLSDLQGLSPTAGFLKWDFLVQLFSTWHDFNWRAGSASRGPSAVAEPLICVCLARFYNLCPNRSHKYLLDFFRKLRRNEHISLGRE